MLRRWKYILIQNHRQARQDSGEVGMGHISFCVSECETRAVMDAPESLGIIKKNTFLGQSLGILTQSFPGVGIVLFPNAPLRHYAASSGWLPV